MNPYSELFGASYAEIDQIVSTRAQAFQIVFELIKEEASRKSLESIEEVDSNREAPSVQACQNRVELERIRERNLEYTVEVQCVEDRARQIDRFDFENNEQPDHRENMMVIQIQNQIREANQNLNAEVI